MLCICVRKVGDCGNWNCSTNNCRFLATISAISFTKVINSDYNVHVFQINKKDLCANISLEGGKYPIAYAEDKYNLMAKLGLKNPVKFMQKAFEKAQKISE